jgi:predicted MFS family arabinose efflux permease
MAAAAPAFLPPTGARRDVLLLLGAGFARTLGVGMCGLVLLVALGAAGLARGEAHAALAAGLLGAAVGLAAVTWGADRWGRRRTLVVLSCLQAVGGGCLAACAGSSSLAVLCAFVGMVNGMGRDRGPAVALEQAILPAATDDRGRTALFARYHLVLDLGHGLGVLLPGLLLAVLPPSLRTPTAALALLGPLGLVSMLCHARLSPAAEQGAHAERPPLSSGSRRILGRLAALFALDSLGGGFLPNALLAVWFFERFGLDLGALGLLFALGRVANALSYLAAARLARRIGLVRTMVFTHVPSSLILLALPLVGSAHLAVGLYLLRELLVEMDLPTRQSYTLAVVAPGERTRAAGLTGLARACAWALGAVIASRVVPHLGLSAPLIVGACLKLVYDGLLFASMRSVRPPEERAPA